MFKNKTVLVTGATGLLGYNLTIALLENGARVIALGRSERKLRDCYDDMISGENIVLLPHDMSEKSLDLPCNVDYIFHAAGSIELKTIINRPMDIIAPNVLGTIACLEVLRMQERKSGLKGRLVYFSSEAIYGKTENDRNVIENDTELTDNLDAVRIPYSESKRIAETIVNSYVKQYDVDAVNVRLAWVYGNTKTRPQQALYEFIKTALEGENLIIRDADTPRRDNLHMSDAISGLLTVALRGNTGEAYNISSNGDLGNYIGADEIAEIITGIINKNSKSNRISVEYKTQRTKRAGGIRMDNSKLKKLGWIPKVDIKSGLERLIKEIQNSVC